MKSILKVSSFIILLIITACSNQQSLSTKNLQPKEFQSAIADNTDKIVLDVRTPEEYSAGHLPGAINIDFNNNDFESQVKALDKSKPVYVYCLSGSRSEKAAETLANDGFNKVYHLEGGILAWQKNDLPIGTATASTTTANEETTQLTNLTEAQLQEYLNKGKTVLIDYNATWCPPCKLQTPIVDQISKEKGDDLIFLSIDVDKNMDLAKSRNVEALPTLEIYKNGKQTWRNVGYTQKSVIMNAIEN